MTVIRERLLLHHPRARAFRTRRGAELLRTLQAGLGSAAAVHASDAPELASRVAALDPERDLIVVAGGDGTLHHSLNLLATTLGTERPWPRIALFPAGTGNDAARSIAALVGRRLTDPRTLFEAVERGAPGTPSDLGRFQASPLPTRYFVNFAGFGAPVDWVRLADARAMAPFKRLAPKLCYSACSLAVLLRRKRIDLTVDAGSGPLSGPVFSLLVANARYLGGGLDLGEHAPIDSGRLALLRLPAVSRARLVSLLTEVRQGRGPELETAEAVHVDLQGPTHANLDGELLSLPQPRIHAQLVTLPARILWI